MVNEVYHFDLWKLFKNLAYISTMNTSPASPRFEIVTMPTGAGWRVCISDGQRMQFVSGFDARTTAEEWVRRSSHAWLDTLKNAAERL